jgi:hypothetical protein
VRLEIATAAPEYFAPISLEGADLVASWPDPVHYLTAFWISGRCGLFTHGFIADGDRSRGRVIGEAMSLTLGPSVRALMVLPPRWDAEREVASLDSYVEPLAAMIDAARPASLSVSHLRLCSGTEEPQTSADDGSLSRVVSAALAQVDTGPRPDVHEMTRILPADSAAGRAVMRNLAWSRIRQELVSLYRMTGLVEDPDIDTSYLGQFRRSNILLRQDAPDSTVKRVAAALFQRRHGIDLGYQ